MVVTEKLIAAYITACKAKRRGINSRRRFERIVAALEVEQFATIYISSEQILTEQIRIRLGAIRPNFDKKYIDLSLAEAMQIF